MAPVGREANRQGGPDLKQRAAGHGWRRRWLRELNDPESRYEASSSRRT